MSVHCGLSLAGPRFVLNPFKIFEGSFGGPTLWHNPHYTSPNVVSIVTFGYMPS